MCHVTLAGARVLVTGSAGFIGTALCAELQSEGAEVAALNRSALDLETGNIAAFLARVAPTVIVHCAGRLGEPSDDAGRRALFAANHLATERLFLAAARQIPVPRVVLVASASIYAPMAPDQKMIAEDHPLWPGGQYGISKAVAVMLAQAMTARGDLEVVTAVPFNVLGPGQSPRFVPQAFVAQLALHPEVLRVGNLSTTRDWVDVRDVASALVALAAPSVPPGLYNIARGEGVSTADLLDRLCNLTGQHPRLEVDGLTAGRPTVDRSVGDPARILRVCSWRARRGLSDSLREMLTT
jgi:nucleoside-diphosphate-sugar epimerase